VILRDVAVVAEGLAFPEGPAVLGDGSVLVVEIFAGNLTRIEPSGRSDVIAHVGGGPSGTAIGPDGAAYLSNSGRPLEATGTRQPSIQRVDLATGEITTLYTGCGDRPLGSPNDLVFDSTGNFWFTDTAGNALYYAAPDGSAIELAVDGVRAPNGVGLSPEEDVVYWAETYTRQVNRRRLSAPGQVVTSAPYDVRSFVAGARNIDPWSLVTGLPGARELDSLAVEADGRICVGTLVESGVTVVDPRDGSWEMYTLPPELHDPVVSNICFGGKDQYTAYITCALTGRILSCEWPRPGLLLSFQPTLSSTGPVGTDR
jgi:gluconolactonase